MYKYLYFTFRAILALGLLASSFPALSGVGSVGHGGGLGELQFIYYFNNIQRIIRLCEVSEICVVTNDQINHWNLLQQNISEKSEQTQVHFVSDLAERQWTWTENKLIISQKWLYQNEKDQLRSDGEIMSLALAIQLSHRLGLNFDSMYLESYGSLSTLNFYNRSTVSNSEKYKFHSIRLSNHHQVMNLFALEDPQNSFLLNDLLLAKSPELDLASLEFYDLQISESSSKIVFLGTMSGTNSGVFFNRRPFKIEAQLGAEGIIMIATLKIFFLLE